MRWTRDSLIEALARHQASYLPEGSADDRLVRSGDDFSGLDLSELDLGSVELFDCDFRGADLTGTAFQNAWLGGSKFGSARAPYADFFKAELTETDFAVSDLTHARFLRVDAMRTKFAGATLDGAVMSDSIYIGCDFSGASLLGTFLRGVTFEVVLHEDVSAAGAIITVPGGDRLTLRGEQVDVIEYMAARGATASVLVPNEDLPEKVAWMEQFSPWGRGVK